MNFIFAATIAFGYLINHGESIHLPCKTTEDCLPFIQDSICNGTIQECGCPDGTILSSDLAICLPIAEGHGSDCQDNTQCSAILSIGGVCSDGACKCEEGYHYLKGVCWKNVGFGEPCTETEECYDSYEYIGFQCVENKCKCKDGFYERFGTGCRRIMHEGEVCFIDSDCFCGENGEIGQCTSNKCVCPNSRNVLPNPLLLVEETKDINGKATCPPGSYPSGDACKLELGMECVKKDECGPSRTNCSDSICACVQFDDTGKFTANSIASPDNRKCLLPISSLDSPTPCTDNAQCATFGGNAKCIDSSCKCGDSSHYIEEDKFCYTSKSLGEDCNSDKDCFTLNGGSMCEPSDKKCRCQKGYHENSNDCFKDAMHVGEECHADDDCLFEDSKCEDSKCACQEGYFESEGLCIQGVDSPCTEDVQCSHVGNSTCNTTTGACECLDGFVSSGNEDFCLPVTDYEEQCKETVQCDENLGDLKECKNGVCSCQEMSHFSNGKCYETKKLGEKCLNKNECVSGQDSNAVFCLNGRCACQYDYVKNSHNKCVKDDDDSNKDNSGNRQQLSILLITSCAFLYIKNM